MSEASKPHSEPLTTIHDSIRLGTVMGPPKFFAALQSLEEQLEAYEKCLREIAELTYPRPTTAWEHARQFLASNPASKP